MTRLTQDDLSTQMLTGLMQAGAFDTRLYPFDERIFSPAFFEWFSTLSDRSTNPQDPHTFEVSPSAQSARWQESHLATITHDLTYRHWAVELARFVVPNGQIGFVKYIEQVVNDTSGSYYPSNVTYWGSPRFVIPDVNNLRWYLTLSYYDGHLPPRYEIDAGAVIPPHALPGAPFNDLFEIDALWYPAHSGKELKLIVPGQSILRMFMISPPTVTYQWEVSGKISGYTQSTYQQAALCNARDV